MTALAMILDHVPWWVWLAFGGLALAAAGHIWVPAWLALPSKVRLGLAALAAAILAYLAGRNAGASGALARRDAQAAEDRARAMRTRQEVDDDVAAMGAADVDREYERWLRDGPK